MWRLLRAAGFTRKNVIFAGAFFGSFALLICTRPDERLVVLWLLSFIIWAAIIRWWIVAGALAGILFYQPQLHNIDIAGHVISVAEGALVGVCIEAFLWGVSHV